MSIIQCTNCSDFIDTDFYPAYYHKIQILFDNVLCEECFLKLPDKEQENYTE